MLRITIHDSSQALTLKLEGKLTGAWVRELEQCWITGKSTLGSRAAVVELADVSFVDADGKQLLARMHAEGVRLHAHGPLTRAIVEEVSRIPRAVSAIVLALLVIPLLHGQPEPAPVRLTLRDAVRTALKQNPQVQIANLTTAQSVEQNTIARSALLPSANMGVSEDVRRGNLEALLGHSFPGFPQHFGPFEVFQAGPSFSVPVFDLTLWRRYRASKANRAATAAQESGVREQTAALVVSQYLGALRASADVRAAQSRVSLAQALYNQAADLQKNGVGTGIDTLRANVELQNENQRLLASQVQQKTTLYGLARLLNVDPNAPVELADEMSFFATPNIQLDESLQAAYNNRPEIRGLQARAQAVEAQRQAAAAGRYPNVRVNGNWNYQGTSAITVIPTYQYGVYVNVPVFTGGRIGAETAQQELEQKKVAQQLQDTRNLIALEVKTAAAQLDSARHEVDVANVAIDLARQEVDQARDRFQAGVANNIEVIQAQDALARANDNQIVALYRYNQARADLARAAGRMESIYAQ